MRPINPPEGLLELEVVEAAGVPRMDWWPGTHADMFVEYVAWGCFLGGL